MLTAHPPTTAPSVRHAVVQGESEVTRDRRVTLTTVLGSCVACCLYDATAGVGGMNHFLLPMPPDQAYRSGDEAERYGLYAMELLVNEMLKRGATRPTMRAHLYGGANLHAGMRAIGTGNDRFARTFLQSDRIALVRSDTGGTLARRLDFQAATGRVRCRTILDQMPETRPPRVTPPVTGDVELF